MKLVPMCPTVSKDVGISTSWGIIDLSTWSKGGKLRRSCEIAETMYHGSNNRNPAQQCDQAIRNLLLSELLRRDTVDSLGFLINEAGDSQERTHSNEKALGEAAIASYQRRISQSASI